MTLDELLANKDLPDTTPIKVGDAEIPLGSLRQFSSSQLAAVTSRAKELDTREQQLTAKQREVMELAGSAQKAYQLAEEARKAAVTGGREPSADPFADPWLAPVKGALDQRDKIIGEQKAALEQFRTMLTNATKVWADDRWDSEYSAINWGKREADKRPTREQLIAYANENKLLDRHGIPSVRAAWSKMSEPDREADLTARAREEGLEQGRREAMAARIPPPSVPGMGMPAAPPKGGPADKGDLGDIFGDAMKDPELRGLIEQLPQGFLA